MFQAGVNHIKKVQLAGTSEGQGQRLALTKQHSQRDWPGGSTAVQQHLLESWGTLSGSVLASVVWPIACPLGQPLQGLPFLSEETSMPHFALDMGELKQADHPGLQSVRA